MKTIYLDSDYKCHITNDGTMRVVMTDALDGMCNAVIEGHRFVPSGESWTREDGVVFNGEMVTPWKDSDELDAIQREYDRVKLAEYEESLKVVGVVFT